MGVFAVTTEKGPAWDPTRDIRQQRLWDDHAAFADGLVEEGVILLGGPLQDDDDRVVALVAVRADDHEHVRALFAADPWIKDDILALKSVKSWTIWLGREPAGPTDTLAAAALARVQEVVAPLPGVQRSDTDVGCYFLVRRKMFVQLATLVDPEGKPVTHVAWKSDPTEREALLATGHPFFTGRFYDRVGRIGALIDETTDWDQISEFVIRSYRRVAPKKLLAELDSGLATGSLPPPH